MSTPRPSVRVLAANHPGRDRALRVWHLGKYYPPASGGIELHVRTLARTLAVLGTDVSVVCVNHRDHRRRDVTWQASRSTPTLVEQDGAVNVLRLGRVASFARLDFCPDIWSLAARLHGEPPDIVHLHVPNPTMLLALAARAPRATLVVTYHSDVMNRPLLGRALSILERRVFPRAARIIVNCPTYVAGSPALRRYPGKLAVIPMGIELEPYLRPSEKALAYASRLRSRHGPILWLTLGRLVPYKGLDDAIRALRQVPGQLLVIGAGPTEDQLRALSRTLGVSDRVVWLGHVNSEEVVGACHAATALWFPSNARNEAFGLAQVEAMASGCPVINTDIPHSGVPWVGRHEVEGLTVPVRDPASLAAAARRLLQEPGLRGSLSRGARLRALCEFDHRRMAEKTVGLYEEILGRAAASIPGSRAA
jgi:rhamnosyl/mannosyltransferase